MAKKSGKPSGSPVRISERIESQDRQRRQQVVHVALAKLQRNEQLTTRERQAIKAWEDENLERWGAQFAAACPKGRYCDEVGIHAKVAIEQSRRFDLPYHRSGKTINLFEQLAAWHAWASEHKHSITRVLQAEQLQDVLEDDDTLDFWQRELVKERAIRERDNRREREKSLLPRELFRQFLQEFYVEAMRRRIEQLEKREEPLCDQLADGLRDDIRTFEEALELLFHEDNEDDLPEPETTDSTA